MTEDWGEFFVAVAGAAAALAGLIIVAMSVTIKQILASPALPSRAASTVSSMVLILVVSVLALIPHQPDLAFGTEVVLASAVGLVPPAVMVRRMARDSSYQRSALSRTLIGLIGVVPVALALVGGILIMVGASAGMAFLAAAIVAV